MKFEWTLKVDDDATVYRLTFMKRVVARVTHYNDDTISWQYFGPYMTAQHWRNPDKEVTTLSSATAEVMILALNDAELRKELFGPNGVATTAAREEARDAAKAAARKKLGREAKARALAR